MPRSKKPRTPSRFDDDPELGTLVTAKRMGLSFEELNMFTMEDWLGFVDMWVGDDDEDEDGVRPATQADIQGFFG